MATKKELETRIAVLEAEIALLKAQRPIMVLPRPADVPWPRDTWPIGGPPIMCGTSISPAIQSQCTINAAA